MTMILFLLRLVIAAGIAFLAGKLVSRFKLPSILGWLIAGMALGPHGFSLVSQPLLDAQWYQIAIHTLECAVGLMIGTELVWKKLKRSGRAIVITTLTQSLGTFLAGLSGVWACVSLQRFPYLSSVHLWWNRAGHRSCTGAIHRPGV